MLCRFISSTSCERYCEGGGSSPVLFKPTTSPTPCTGIWVQPGEADLLADQFGLDARAAGDVAVLLGLVGRLRAEARPVGPAAGHQRAAAPGHRPDPEQRQQGQTDEPARGRAARDFGLPRRGGSTGGNGRATAARERAGRAGHEQTSRPARRQPAGPVGGVGRQDRGESGERTRTIDRHFRSGQDEFAPQGFAPRPPAPTRRWPRPPRNSDDHRHAGPHTSPTPDPLCWPAVPVSAALAPRFPPSPLPRPAPP